MAGDIDDEPPGAGFRCNWDSLKKHWADGSSPVDVLVVDGEALGFLNGYDILEIRPDKRRRGYGEQLATHMLERAFAEGRSVSEIQIAPPTARPFWERMGFTVIENKSNPWVQSLDAYKVLRRPFMLGGGEQVPYEVSFTAEESYYKTPSEPFAVFKGYGERLANGAIQLPERAYCHRPGAIGHEDYFATILLAGKSIFDDKTKRDEAKAIGIKRDAGYVYYLDRIELVGANT